LAKTVRTAPLRDAVHLERRIGELHRELEAAGRSDPIDICCTPFSHPHWRERFEPDRLRDEAAQLAALGVTWLSIRLPSPSRHAFLEHVARFGDELIPASR
jgi:hypothetical protein